MVLNFAHRGSLTEAPENTLPAFLKAIHHDAKAIELDVQLTKDNHLIICHDHKLTRFNKQEKRLIKDLTHSEIKQIDIGSSFSDAYKGLTLATLEEFLEFCPPHIILNIEIKNIPIIYDGIERILINTLKKFDRIHNVIISSFDHVALKNVQEITNEIKLGMLFYYRLWNEWEYAKQSGLKITSIHPNQVYTDRNYVENCKALGYQVYPYTVNDIGRYEELVAFGVDGVFSNEPGVFGG